MSLRVRNGIFYCAALTKEGVDDFYISDRKHYNMSVIRGSLVTNQKGLHKRYGGVWKPIKRTNILNNKNLWK